MAHRTRSKATGRFISRAAAKRRRNLKLFNPRGRKRRSRGRALSAVYVRGRGGKFEGITSFKRRKYYRRKRGGGKHPKYVALSNRRRRRRRHNPGKAHVWYGKRKRGGRRRKLFRGRPRRIYRRSRRGPRRYVAARNRARRRRRNYTGGYLMDNPRRRRRSRKHNRARRRGRRRAHRNPFAIGGLSLGSFTRPVMDVTFWKNVAIGAVGVVAVEVAGNKVYEYAARSLAGFGVPGQYLATNTLTGGIARGAVKVALAGGLGAVAGRFIGADAAKVVLIGTGVLVAKDILESLGVFSTLGLGDSGFGAYATQEYGLRGLDAYATEEYGLRGRIPGVGLGGMIPGSGLGEPLADYYKAGASVY